MMREALQNHRYGRLIPGWSQDKCKGLQLEQTQLSKQKEKNVEKAKIKRSNVLG